MRDKKETAESRRVFVGQMFTSSTIGPHLLSQNIVHVSTRRRHPANSALAAQRLQLIGWKCVVHVRPICVVEHFARLKNKSSIKEKVSRASEIQFDIFAERIFTSSLKQTKDIIDYSFSHDYSDKEATYLSSFRSFSERLCFNDCEFTKLRKKTKTITKCTA